MILEQSRLKVRRANAHIDELNEITSLNHYNFVGHEHPKLGKRTIPLHLGQVPEDAMLIAGEVTYQLRSSLDLAAVALAKFAGTADVSGVYFPFASSEGEFFAPKGSPQKKMRPLPEASKAVIAALKPYPGGNDFLVALGRLGNTDKHIKLIAAATLFQITNLVRIDPNQVGSFIDRLTAGELIGMMMSAAIKAGGGFHDGFEFDITIAGIAPDRAALSMQEHAKLAVTICLSEAGIFENEPVVPTLHQLSGQVTEMLDLLEASVA